MILGVFATETVTRLRRAPVLNEDGEPAYDGHGRELVDDVAPLPIEGCSVDPGVSEENVVGQDATKIAWTVYAPPGTDVIATDRLVYRGLEYEIDGPPRAHDGGIGLLDHLVILLTRWEG